MKECILSYETFKDGKRIDYFFILDNKTGKVKREKVETNLVGEF